MADPVLGAVGKVCTGFSHPVVAKYNEENGVISYTNRMTLARGVDVSIEPDTPEDNDFYADNVRSESAPEKFTSGNVNLTVDGLLVAAERMIMGLPEPDTDGWVAYGDNMNPPYIGIGYVARYMSGGVESFVPTIMVKTKFNIIQNAAATQEEEIDWQTQALTARLFRGDDTNHNWKLLGKDYATEAEAIAALDAKLA